MSTVCSGSEREGKLHARALLLSYFTVGYNVVEGVASVAAGALAGSIALVGFGLDSFIESISGGVMIWRFSQRGLTEEEERRVEAKAAKLVGWSFFVLAAYILFEAAKKLLQGDAPQPSLFGIIVAVA
ncbi:hypothetical protein FJY70_01690, partial [candidate division WOR-3 bacterium]|nr:hypothetical protein [candidate division WOR-3 bacterium]